METPNSSGLKVVIVISEFNPVITESLLNGAMDAYITCLLYTSDAADE